MEVAASLLHLALVLEHVRDLAADKVIYGGHVEQQQQRIDFFHRRPIRAA